MPAAVAVLEAALDAARLLAGNELAGVELGAAELAGVELAAVLLRDELLGACELLPEVGVAVNALELDEPSAVVYFTQNQ